jgi:hypothetical protein
VEQLRVECNQRDAQDILTDAIARVPGFVAPAADLAPLNPTVHTGLASLAIGDRQFARALLPFLADMEYLILVARHFLWSGEDAVLRAELARIDRTLQEVAPFAELHELAIALESIGAGAEAAAVRARATNAEHRLLPVWDTDDCNELPISHPAHTVNFFMHGLLGAAPDAARGRLRLRLCLPDWIDRLKVENIRMADALITLRYESDGNSTRCSIEQVAGAMPVRLIFEPTFSSALSAVFVDDVAADLAWQPLGARVVAPVQLMLDHERVVRFESA